MSNFTFLAQNNEKDSYVKQACLLAMSIRATNRNSKICLITNDNVSLLTPWVLAYFVKFIFHSSKVSEKADKGRNRKYKIYKICNLFFFI